MENFLISWWWSTKSVLDLWKFLSSGVWLHVILWNGTYVLEQRASMIFRTEDGDGTFHQNVGDSLPKYILEDNNCCSRYCENLKCDMFRSYFKIVQVLCFIRIKS